MIQSHLELGEMLGAVAEEAMVTRTRPVTDQDLAYWAMVADIELHGIGAPDDASAGSTPTLHTGPKLQTGPTLQAGGHAR